MDITDFTFETLSYTMKTMLSFSEWRFIIH